MSPNFIGCQTVKNQSRSDGNNSSTSRVLGHSVLMELCFVFLGGGCKCILFIKRLNKYFMSRRVEYPKYY